MASMAKRDWRSWPNHDSGSWQSPTVFQGQEGMLDLGADSGFTSIGFLVGICQGRIPISTQVGEKSLALGAISLSRSRCALLR